MKDVLSVLLASLAEDFDIDVVEHTSDGTRERLCVELRVSEQQLQAARSKIIDARARFGIVSEPAAPASLEANPSER